MTTTLNLQKPPVKLKAHPLTNIVPKIMEGQYAALKADIKKYGCLNKIVLYQGMILEGVNRYQICQELEIDCPTREKTFPNGCRK
jgi:hypothetical protein